MWSCKNANSTNEKLKNAFYVAETCQFFWNCTITQWTSFCDQKMKFATTVTTGNKVAWAISIIVLGATVISDVYDHLSVMRHVTFVFKLMLIL